MFHEFTSNLVNVHFPTQDQSSGTIHPWTSTASLREGRLPSTQKHAVVTPLLKKSGLDVEEPKNYRPVSNLTFVSKLVERAVASRLVTYLNANGLMPPLQSAYRRHHSTETALLKLLSDVYGAIDCQQVVLLGLLYLSAAFDCVDHEILLSRLRYRFGLHGSAYDWIASFLYGRSQQVFYKGRLAVCQAPVVIRRSTRVCFGPSAVRTLHRRQHRRGCRGRIPTNILVGGDINGNVPTNIRGGNVVKYELKT